MGWIKGMVRVLAMAALAYIAVKQSYEWGAPGEFQEEPIRAVAAVSRQLETIALSQFFSVGACPEGGSESSIMETRGRYELVRDHCSDLETAELIDNRRLEARGDQLVYNGQTFKRE